MKGKTVISLAAGLAFGGITWIVLLCLQIEDAFLMAAFSGIGYYLMMYPFLIAYEKVLLRRYKKLEKTFPAKILYKAGGNFRLANGKMKSGYVYFCEDGIRCACMEEKPYLFEEIPLHTIEYCRCDITQISIFTKAAGVYVATVPEAYKLRDVLIEKGWNFPE